MVYDLLSKIMREEMLEIFDRHVRQEGKLSFSLRGIG